MKYSETNEIWRLYPEFDFIEVSTLGRARTLDRVVSNGKGTRVEKGMILKQWLNKRGYLRVAFRKDSKLINKPVHRLVAQTFIPNPDNLQQVNHKDCNPQNNSVSNLEWCTPEYNIEYREKYGKSSAEISGCPVYAVNLDTSEISKFKSQREAGRVLGIVNQSINSVLKGRLKATHGYVFTKAVEEDEIVKLEEEK
ncbi:NUMOD4 domain-containing protein (plasmid) [Lacticaseibacillus paracasei]|uniref:NUMOD4 domain-containing protein n=1 Tax=Lacticaseibacillus paracasei TaxID=1597 RepID=UPI00359422F7